MGHFWVILVFFGNFSIFYCQLIWYLYSCYYLAHLGNPKMATYTYFPPFSQCCNFLLFFRLAYHFSPLIAGNLGWHIKFERTTWIFGNNMFSDNFNHSGVQKWPFLAILKKSVFSFSAHFREFWLVESFSPMYED